MRRTATSAAFCVGLVPSSPAGEGGAKRRMRGSIRASQCADPRRHTPHPRVIVATGVAALSRKERGHIDALRRRSRADNRDVKTPMLRSLLPLALDLVLFLLVHLANLGIGIVLPGSLGGRGRRGI